ncbi:unnamed protein product, partial [marine sediment metagenome]
LVRPIAPLITTLQILQMVGGLGVFVAAGVSKAFSDPEHGAQYDAANWKLGLGMYLSYFVLFVVLFVEKYGILTTRGTAFRVSKRKTQPSSPTGLPSYPVPLVTDSDMTRKA